MIFKSRPKYYYHYETNRHSVGYLSETCVYTKGKAKRHLNFPIPRQRSNNIRAKGKMYLFKGYRLEVAAALTMVKTNEPRALVDLIVGELYDRS